MPCRFCERVRRILGIRQRAREQQQPAEPIKQDNEPAERPKE
jgi:hypothetical protein